MTYHRPGPSRPSVSAQIYPCKGLSIAPSYSPQLGQCRGAMAGHQCSVPWLRVVGVPMVHRGDILFGQRARTSLTTTFIGHRERDASKILAISPINTTSSSASKRSTASSAPSPMSLAHVPPPLSRPWPREFGGFSLPPSPFFFLLFHLSLLPTLHDLFRL